MAQVTRPSVADVEVLASSWRLHLAAERKSPATITAYSYATTQLATFLREQGMPTSVEAITREHIETFLVHVIETRSASTAETRYRGLRGFFGWLEEEGEITASPMARMKPPKVAEQPVDVPTLADARKLLDACAGNEFEARRDAAIIRLFADAGIRLAELTGVKLDDVDLAGGAVLVHGKGDRYRMASFGRKTAKALDRYLRSRTSHVDAESERVWLGLKGPMRDPVSVRCSGGDPVRPESRACTRTSSDTSSRIRGSPKEVRKRTSWLLPAGRPVPWSLGTQHRPKPSAHMRRIVGSRRVIGCDRSVLGDHRRSGVVCLYCRLARSRRSGQPNDWAEIIDMLTMYPESRRRVARLLAEVDADNG